MRLIRLFLYSAGMIFLIVAVAKIISGAGGSRILALPDPIVQIPYRYLLLLAGLLELVVALVCLRGKDLILKAWAVAWIASIVGIYRLGLLSIHYVTPCSCLGTFTASLNVKPETADLTMKAILIYLLLGSYTTLLWLWRQRRAPLSRSLAITQIPL